MRGGRWQVALALAALAIACSSKSSGPSADKACTDQARGLCAKYAECSTYLMQTRFGGDLSQCEANEKQFCMNVLGAPASARTAQATEDCYATYGSVLSCDDFIASNLPPACAPPRGTYANAASCAISAQCASGYCEIPAGFACGKCAPAKNVGDSCASTHNCPTITTGQYCTTTTNICAAPVPRGGTCDGVNLLCVGTFTCAGLTMTSNGTCQPGLTTLGADCVPPYLGGAGCNFQDGLGCDPASKKCIALVFAAPGQPCGQLNAFTTYCANQGFCRIPQGQTAGTCIAVAADGTACDSSVGPGCAWRSTCVVTSGTSGTCRPNASVSCQ